MRKRKLLTLLFTMVVIALGAGSALAGMATGVTLDFNASDPASGVSSSNWNSLTEDSSSDWVFGDDVTLENVVFPATGITRAYRFTGGDGAQTSSYNKYAGPDFFTIEIWLKPSDTGADSQVVFETGAGFRGMAVWYQKGTDSDGTGTINFTVDDGSNYDTVSAEIDTTKFTQVTGVYSRNIDAAGTDLLEIFIDGVFVAENREHTGINNWGGGNAAGLASTLTAACSGVPGDSGSFDGYISIFRFWEGKGLTAAEVSGNYKALTTGYVNIISPLYGAVVDASPAAATLLWENLDPNTDSGATSTYVDVWFGTDPNKTDGPANNTYQKVVTGGQDTVSFITDSLAPGIYYWQVDSYLHGDPATTAYPENAEPNMIEGQVYMFTNDGPIASVDAPDMVSWTGAPIDLYAAVDDDGRSALDYEWVLSMSPGLVADWTSPVSYDVAPVLTLTKVSYILPYAENGSFEENDLADEESLYHGDVPAWSGAYAQPIGSENWTNHWEAGGVVNPSETMYTTVPEGENVGRVKTDQNSDHSIYQQTRLTIEAGKTYILSAMVGNPADNTTGIAAKHHIQIEGAGIAAVSPSGNAPVPGEWASVSATYTAGADEIADPNVGQPLVIRLVAEQYDSTVGHTQVHFDNVVLTVDDAAGSEQYDPVSTATVTATVQDQTNPAVSDTMTIEVYEDACQAALVGAGLGAENPADFDANCINDLADFAVFAEKWLNNQAPADPYLKY